MRYFNTTSSNYDKQSSKESGSGKSDKEPDKNEDIKILLRKLWIWFALLYVILFAFRQQIDRKVEVSFSLSQYNHIKDSRYYN